MSDTGETTDPPVAGEAQGRLDWDEGPDAAAPEESWLTLDDDDLLLRIESVGAEEDEDDRLLEVVESHRHFFVRQEAAKRVRARSRDPGLHGRKPVFRTPRQLAASYMDAYVDLTGRVTGYAVCDLRELGDYDWRLSSRNVWKVERWLIDYPHRPLRMSDARYARLFARYKAFKARYPDRKPVDYEGREAWL